MERNERIADLVRQVMEGDASAFEELYRSTYKGVFFHAKKVLNNEQDVEDAVSETYVRVFENLSKLQDPALFQPWVNRIATNISLNMVRDDRYRDASSFDDEDFFYEPVAADADTPNMVLDRKGTEEIIGGMIDALPEVQRTTVILYYYDEMSVAAIAKAMGCSEGTVKSRLNYARKNLEQAVLAEEKRGVKLYSVTPALVLTAIRRMIAASPISRASVINTAQRIAEGMQPGSSPAPSGEESRGAESSSAAEESTRRTAPSRKKPPESTGRKAAAAGKTSAKAAGKAAAATRATAAAAAKTGIVVKIVAAVFAGALLFGAGILTTNAAAREAVSQYLEDVPVIGDLLSRNSQASTHVETNILTEEDFDEQSPLSPLSAAPKEIVDQTESMEAEIVGEEPVSETPADPMAAYLAAYEPVFESYRAFIAGEDKEIGNDESIIFSYYYHYGDLGVSRYPFEAADYSQLGYLLLDLDGDGVPELIIGDMRPYGEYDKNLDTEIYDMFTLQNGYPKRVLASSARDRYKLYPDNLILNDGDSSAFSFKMELFRFNGVDKEFVYALMVQQPDYYEVTVNREDLWHPEDTDHMISQEEFRAKQEEIYNNVIHLKLTPLPCYEEQTRPYRQFILRGDLMKSYDLDVSQLRYRLYDSNNDGVSELFFATPIQADSDSLVIGLLWLDDNNQVRQTLSSVSREYGAMIGTVRMNGKLLRAEYISNSMLEEWVLYDPNVFKNPEDIITSVNVFTYYPGGGYEVNSNNEYQITVDQFPHFYEQVKMIVGTGSQFDSYDNTISYEELIGSETPDPELVEYEASVDWEQNRQFPSERMMNLSYDGTLHTLPFAEDAVIHIFGKSHYPCLSFWDHSMSLDELIEEYYKAVNVGSTLFACGGKSYVQIKNGEIVALWMDNPVAG